VLILSPTWSLSLISDTWYIFVLYTLCSRHGVVVRIIVLIQLLARKFTVVRSERGKIIFKRLAPQVAVTECTTTVKITASSYAAFDKKIFLMFRTIVLSPFSGRPNLVSVDSAMTGRRECVHYVAVLGTIGPGYFIRHRDSLRTGRWIESLRRRDIPQPSRPALWLIQLRTQWALCLFQG